MLSYSYLKVFNCDYAFRSANGITEFIPEGYVNPVLSNPVFFDLEPVFSIVESRFLNESRFFLGSGFSSGSNFPRVRVPCIYTII